MIDQKTLRHQTILGFDVGGTKTAIVEGTHDAAILQREEILTEAARPFGVAFPRVVAVAEQIIGNATAAGRVVAGLSAVFILSFARIRSPALG